MDMIWGEYCYILWSEVVQGLWVLFIFGLKSFNILVFIGVYGFMFEENECDSYLQVLKGCDGFFFFFVLVLVVYIVVYCDGVFWFDVLCDYLQVNMCYVVDMFNNVFFVFCWQLLEVIYLVWIDLCLFNVDDCVLQQVLIVEQKVVIMLGYIYGFEGNGFLCFNVGCLCEKLECGVEGLIVVLCSFS